MSDIKQDIVILSYDSFHLYVKNYFVCIGIRNESYLFICIGIIYWITVR